MNSKKTDYRDSHTAKDYGKNYDVIFDIHPYRRSIWTWEQKILKEITVSLDGPNVLDFACGTGRIIKLLKSNYPNIQGVDVSESMIEVCRVNNPNIKITKADLTTANPFYKEPKFNVITAFRFFLNAQNSLRVDVLSELRKIIDEEGTFIFNIHGNKYNLGLFLEQWILVKNLFRKDPSKKYVVNKLSYSDVESLLTNAGFEITKTYHRNVIPVLSEQSNFDLSKWDKLENWFSNNQFFRPFARNVIYVCKPKK